MDSLMWINLQWLSTGYIIATFIVSTIWFSYFIYGKKNWNTISLMSGLILMFFPYLIHDIKYIILIAVILCILPFILNI